MRKQMEEAEVIGLFGPAARRTKETKTERKKPERKKKRKIEGRNKGRKEGRKKES